MTRSKDIFLPGELGYIYHIINQPTSGISNKLFITNTSMRQICIVDWFCNMGRKVEHCCMNTSP